MENKAKDEQIINLFCVNNDCAAIVSSQNEYMAVAYIIGGSQFCAGGRGGNKACIPIMNKTSILCDIQSIT